MKVIYNGNLGQNIKAGEIPFTAGEATEVADEAVVASLLTKPHFSAEVIAPTVATKSKTGTATVTEGGA